jgi:3-(3-hydroxy-phenyl)propionate hydroxylase
VFEDQFLIADVKMTAAFPTERWFWFRPPFHQGQSALLHKQPDDIWRIDLQLGREADAEVEKRPETVRRRVAAMLGHADFELEWVSVYRFQCRRLERFVHDRVIFAGDSAHQVSPFGARGANSGIQDADNLGWKLAAVLKGEAAAALIATYDLERVQAAEENILNSTRATDFMAPPSPGEQVLRDAALALAPHADFAKRFVNSGRLSLPTAYAGTPLSTPDDVDWGGGVPPGAPFLDAPLAGRAQSLLTALSGGHFTLLIAGTPPVGLYGSGIDCVALGPEEAYQDAAGLVRQRYRLEPGDAVLFRPDGHVAARFRKADAARILAARDRALGRIVATSHMSPA